MPFDDAKILEFIQYQKSDEAPFIIYEDLECTIVKIIICKNNPENSSTNIFYQVSQCLQYLWLEAYKISMG